MSPFLVRKFNKVVTLNVTKKVVHGQFFSEWFCKESAISPVFSKWFCETFQNNLGIITRLAKQTNTQKRNSWVPMSYQIQMQWGTTKLLDDSSIIINSKHDMISLVVRFMAQHN